MVLNQCKKAFRLLPALLLGLFVALSFLASAHTQAAAGINSQINFQARLLTSEGATVPDGFYNIEFKIYQDGDGQSSGDTTGSPAGTLKWTEAHLNNNSQGVTVKNGYLSVQLGSITPFGSSIDWNQDALWLSINIGTTNATCTSFSSCGGDGEMLPMKRLTAAPYAINSSLLGGLSSTQFVQLAQGLQTDAGNSVSSIAINKTGTGGNFFDLQAGGVDAFTLNNSGNVIFGNNANHTISVTTAGAGVAGKSLTLVAGTAGTGGSALAGGDLVLQGGAGGGTNGNGGNVTIDAGVKNATGTDGVINIGTVTASAINIAKSGVTTTINGDLVVASDINTTSGGFKVGGSTVIDSSKNIGNVGTISTSGAINSQTISAAASFTGTLNVATGFKVNGAAATGNFLRGDGTNFVGSAIQAGDVPSGSTYYVQNGTGVQANTNFYTRSAAVGSVGGVIEGANGQTADLLNLNSYNGTSSTIVTKVDKNGNLTAASLNTAGFAVVGSSIASTQLSVVEATGLNGVAIKAAASSPGDLLQLLDSSGIVQSKFNSAGQLTLGTIASSGPVYQGQLSFADGTVDNFGVTLKTNGAIGNNRTIFLPDEAGTICLRNSSNCGFVSGSGSANFINNSTSVENNANFYIRSNGDTVTGVLEGSNGQTADLLDLNTYNGTSSTTVAKFTAAGNLTFNQASTISSASGNLTVQGASQLLLGNSTSTTVSIQPAGSGTLSLGTANASTIAIGSTNASTTVSIQAGGGITIGTGNAAPTIQIGNIANNVAQTINIGNNATSGSTNTIIVGNLQGASTTTIQAGSGNINLTTNQTGAGTIIKTTTNNSTSALSVQNSTGNNVFGVDTTNGQAILGKSSAVNGTLLFKNSSNSNAITLNSTAATSNYTLTLPSSAPAAGLCLETSQASAAQLVFVSCSNNNASIQKVAAWDANNTNTISVSPSSIGDEIVLTTQIPTSGVTVSSVSGGGVSNWTKAIVSAGNGTVNRVEMWVGTVATTGSSTITVTYSASPGVEELTATEFTASGVNASTSWGIESSGAQLNSSSSSTVTYPNLTAINGYELYIGYAQVQNPPASAGSTTGFTYLQTSTQHNMLTYNTATSANTPYQPAANQSSAGQSNTVAAILTAFVSSTSINNSTSLQKANFNVQAATSGSIAGVLQAASSGTADVLNIRDSSANNVLTVGYTGNVTLKPSVSTKAFQVQNGSSQGILTVDTSNNRVMLGSSNAIAGLLTFTDPGDTNTISLSAPSTIAATYTLTLPNNAPTAGLCLGTSPSNANQLIFASCATQVSAAAITYVNQWSSSGTSITTLADAPANVGNLLVLYSHGTNNVNITGISGGGVTNWTKVTSNIGGTGQGNNEMWRGVVTGTGAGTITVTYSAAAGANEITAQEFTMGGTGGGTWAVDTSGATTGSSTTINYPSLTPANSSELYTGYAWGANTMSAGSTSGFTYRATNSSKYTAADPNVTGGVAVQPTASQSVSGNYNAIAALIQAYAGTSVIVNSTAAQQANFNVQAATAGTVAGVLQGASSGSADIFQAKDGNANNVLSVNSSTGTTLGSSNNVTGLLTFASATSGNTVSLMAPAAPGTSYILTLPSATPAAGQCLAAGAANPNQLVFSSCANQVTSVAISFVNNWKGTSSTNTVTLADSPVNLGDLMTVFVSAQKADTVTSVSGGGVTVWSKVAATSSGSGNDTTSMEMWRGIVTSTGASTITANLSGPTGTHEIAAMEFTTGSSTGSWVVDSSNTQVNTTGTTVTFPSIAPQSVKDLYVGYGAGSSAVSAGSTSGYTYIPGSLSNRIGLYNPAISATSQPTATQASSGASIAVGALIAAYSSSSVIANSTVTQQANLNVQAGLANSVAAVLQAGQSGTADVEQILDIAGTVVDSFSNTGNLLIQPSTASANALRVQTTTGTNVLSVDTNSNLVVVGAGSTGEATPSLLVLDNRTGTSNDPTVLNGAMYYNATSHSFRCGVDGTWQTCSGLLYSNTSNSSANNNCSSNCSAFSTTASIPANYCQPGRVIKLHATGYFSSAATPSNLQFGVYYGTDATTASSNTQIGTLPDAQTVTSANNNYFQISYNIICFSTSSMQGEGTMTLQTGSSSTGMSVLPMNSTSATTVVSSTAKNLYIFPIWDTASTSNAATITQYTVSAD